ncbi:MAG: porin [Marinobacter sp.]|nr:porin [Marinobacter sp.]MDX5473117.1 porin [Marinobacter sp.]
MKKHLLALAVSAVVVAPGVALASSDFYGKINLSLDNVDLAEGAGVGGSHTLTSNKTYFGVRGNSELDHGLKALYQLEFGVNPDRSTLQTVLIPLPVIDLFTLRNSFLGFEGGFGTIRAGRMDTPLREMGFMVDQFQDQLYADKFNLMAGEWRADNAIQYATPKLADLVTVTVGTVAPEGDEANGVGGANQKLFDSFSVTAVFDLGDAFVGIGHDRNNYGMTVQNGLDGSIIGLITSGIGGGVDNPGNIVDIYRVVAGMKMDSMEVGALVQESEDVNNSDLKDFSWMLSGSFNVSDALKIKAQYGVTDGDNADVDLQQATLGVDYRLGAQTRTYAYATRAELDGDRALAVVGIGAEHRF